MKTCQLPERSTVCSKHFLSEDLEMSGGGEDEVCALRSGAATVVDALMCRICFAADCELYRMTEHEILHEAFETLTGLSLGDGTRLPRGLCGGCSQRLLSCARFRARSLRSHSILLEVVQKHDRITLDSIRSVVEVQPEAGREPSAADGVKVEPEDPRPDGANVAAIDICSLRDDISVEVMGAECDDAPAAVKAERVDPFENDGVGELYQCDQYSAVGDGHSSDDSRPLRQIKTENLDRCHTDVVTRHARHAGHDDGDLRAGVELSCETCPHGANVVEFLTHLKVDPANSSHSRDKRNSKTTNKTQRRRRRRNVHSGEKSYSCDVCNNRFTLKCNLRNHMKIHTGERPFPCDVCDKRFRRSDHLKSHSLIHTGERPHSCEVCGRRFRTSNMLRQHSKLHSGDRSFSCEVCSRRFIRKCNLETHSRTHSGEKPYSCEVCNKTFSLRCNLRYHLRVHCGQ